MVMVFEYLTKKIGMAQYLAKLIICKICKSGDRILEIGINSEPEKSAKILQVKSANNLNVYPDKIYKNSEGLVDANSEPAKKFAINSGDKIFKNSEGLIGNKFGPDQKICQNSEGKISWGGGRRVN